MLGAQAGAGPAGFMASGPCGVVAESVVATVLAESEEVAVSVPEGEPQEAKDRPSANAGTAHRKDSAAEVDRKGELI